MCAEGSSAIACLLAHLVDFLMAVCPSLGYISQAYRVGWLQSLVHLEGYSVTVSYILLGSQSIRVLYFICASHQQSTSLHVKAVMEEGGVENAVTTTTTTTTTPGSADPPFSLALLAQSLIMFTTQVVLVYSVLRTHHHHNPQHHQAVASSDSSPKSSPTTSTITIQAMGGSPQLVEHRSSSSYFPASLGSTGSLSSTDHKRIDSSASQQATITRGELPTTQQFFQRLFLLVLALGGIAIVYPKTHISPELLGYIALGLEALLVTPQLIQNFRRKSCAGVSTELLATWIGGDVLKFIYFVAKAQPAPFIVCNVFQLCLDAVLIGQIFVYGR